MLEPGTQEITRYSYSWVAVSPGSANAPNIACELSLWATQSSI